MTAVHNFPPAPVGQQGPPPRRRSASREGAPRHARVPPIDYRDGLSPCLTSHQETDITTIIQRRRQHPRHTGRDRRYAHAGVFGEIPIVSEWAFWFMVGAYLLWLGVNHLIKDPYQVGAQ